MPNEQALCKGGKEKLHSQGGAANGATSCMVWKYEKKDDIISWNIWIKTADLDDIHLLIHSVVFFLIRVPGPIPTWF